MADRDYYEVLGVSRSSSSQEIKQAYRKLAIKYHPDKNRGNKQAEDKFKEATNAYEILSDSKKKAAYDQFGAAGLGQFAAGAQGQKAYADFSDVFGDVGDIFGDIFGSSFGGFASAFGGRGFGSSYDEYEQGTDLRYNLEIDLEDVFSGKEVKLEFPRQDHCDRCNGKKAEPGTEPTGCNTCGGLGKIRRAQGAFSVTASCPTCKGSGTQIKTPCKKCRGLGTIEKTRTINLKIPAGIKVGSRLKIANEGEPSKGKGKSGDLYVVIYIREHSTFERDEDDLIINIDIPVTHALIGEEIEIMTIDKRKVKMFIPSGTVDRQIFRLKGNGLPRLASYSGGRGDLRVIVHLKMPKQISKRAIELSRQLAEELEKTTNYAEATVQSKL